MAALMAGMVAANLAGGVMGMISSSKNRAAFERATQEALAFLDAVPQPPDRTAEILIEKYRQAGVLTPEMEKKINLDVSRVSQIQEDQGLRQRQMEALDTLSRASKTGIGPEERAAFNQMRQEVQRDAEAKRQQILQNLAARGQAGSGSELIAQLQASQAADDRASMEGDRLAAQASQRALQALTQMGSMSGQVRGQDFDIASTKAGAEDQFDIQRFNEAVSRQRGNIDRGNEAQRMNLGERQRIGDVNVQAANTEKYRQDQARQDLWNSQFALAQAKAGARSGAAQNMFSAGQQGAQGWANLGAGVGNALLAGSMMSQSGSSPSGNTSTSTTTTSSGSSTPWKLGNFNF